MKQITRLFFALSIFPCAASSIAAQYQFEVDKTPLAGYDGTWLLGIADDGTKYEYVFNQAGTASLAYINRHGNIEPLTNPGQFSPSDLASGGLMSGTSFYNSTNRVVPALRKRNGQLELIPLPAGSSAQGNGVSNSGRVVGNYVDHSFVSHGFLYHGGKTAIYDYPGSIYTVLNDVNNGGSAVGYAYKSDLSYVVFVTDGKRTVPIDTGSDPLSQFIPRYINNSGMIAGSVATYTDADGWTEAPAVYDRKSVTTINSPKTWPATIGYGQNGLPTTLQYVFSRDELTGLNDRGDVSVVSVASYQDAANPWIEYTFVESYIGHQVKA